MNWYLNNNKLNLNEVSLVEGGEKYAHACTQYEIFKYYCYLSIENYNNKDVGEYLVTANLKENPNLVMELRTNVIKPSKIEKIIFDLCFFFFSSKLLIGKRSEKYE